MFTLKAFTSKGSQYFKAFGRYGNQTFTSFRIEAMEFKTEEDAKFFTHALMNTKVTRNWTIVQDAENVIS